MANALSNFIDTNSHDQLLAPFERLKEGKTRRRLSNAGRYMPSSRRCSNISLPFIETNTPSRTIMPAPPRPLLTRHSVVEGTQYGPNMMSFIDNNAETRLPDILRPDTAETKLSDKFDTTQAESDLVALTPEPEVFGEFKVFEKGLAVLSEDQRRRSGYRPRYCWCNRCQMMYSLYLAGDPALDNWGNYPCHQW